MVAAIEFVGARFLFAVLVGGAVGWLLTKASGEATVGVAVGLLAFVGALIVDIASRLSKRRNRVVGAPSRP